MLTDEERKARLMISQEIAMKIVAQEAIIRSAMEMMRATVLVGLPRQVQDTGNQLYEATSAWLELIIMQGDQLRAIYGVTQPVGMPPTPGKPNLTVVEPSGEKT